MTAQLPTLPPDSASRRVHSILHREFARAYPRRLPDDEPGCNLDACEHCDGDGCPKCGWTGDRTDD